MASIKNLNIISALFLAYSSLMPGLTGSSALAQQPATATRNTDAGNTIELADNAPDRHIVVPGDTLWGIATVFLKQPFRWPEIWRLNQDQIRNPHRIYPGQVVVLDRSGDRPQLKLANAVAKLSPHIYVKDNEREIYSIPPNAIEPFLSQPLVVDANGFDNAVRIVATQEDRVVVGSGNLAYVTGMNAKETLWQIYRPGKPLVDPETSAVLGYEAFYLGSARLLAPGEPATIEIINARQEIGLDDRLVPAPRPEIINYVPRSPAHAVKGHVVSVYGSVAEGGKHSIVTISRGKQQGIEVGHVLALSRSRGQVEHRFEDKLETYRLPDERYGLLFVFRVFENVSYALVMDVTRSVVVGDAISTP